MMVRFNFNIVLLIAVTALLSSCYEETSLPVKAQFSFQVVNDDLSAPVQVQIFDSSEGADHYEWTFEGATPSTSSDKNPGTILYNTAGHYQLKLRVSNVDGEEDVFVKEITIYPAIEANFSTQVIDNNYPPAEYVITNNFVAEGASYEWSFPGGTPATFSGSTPPNVTYNQEGDYEITLTVSTGFESFQQTQTISVAPDIVADFDWEVSFESDDYQVPVNIQLNNHSISATSYNWTFPGGTPGTSTVTNPNVIFNIPGNHTITLTADNGKHTSVYSLPINVLADTNLRTFTNVKFGINSANNNNVIGAFYSTVNRVGYTPNEINSGNGPDIDLVFSGLNSTFSFNKFVSPDQTSSNGLMTIPGATHTKIINSQEICNCGGLSVSNFDSMNNDNLLQNITVTDNAASNQSFNQSTVPRIVLFQSGDGRKGAIKIKQFVNDGANSYILTDIKVQKQGN